MGRMTRPRGVIRVEAWQQSFGRCPMHTDQELPVAVPDYVLFDFLETQGEVPPARWGHTAVVIDQNLYVYGGEGSQCYGDLQLFQPGGN